MDLSSFEGLAQGFEEGVDVEILHPTTGAKTGLVVRVASYQSERVKRIQRRLANEALKEQKRNPRKVTKVEEAEEKAHDIIVAAVISWEGFELGGKPLECTPENVRKVVSNPDLWFIAEQIDKAADDQAAFIKA